jgi:putative copper export protein
MYNYVLLLHVLAATVWTGGHLVLATAILPRVLKTKSPNDLLQFEAAYEKVGMSALVIQVLSGLWMAHARVPDMRTWFSLSSPMTALISLKLALLAATVATALDARLRIVPHLSAENLPAMARRIYLITVLSVGFVVVGVSFRTGLLL